MQPNNPFEPTPTGIDYLNHIAPPAAPSGFDKKSKIIVLLAGVLGLLSLGVIGFIAVSQSNSGPSPLHLVARLQKLDKLTEKYGEDLRATALQDANSTLSAVLITTNQAIAKPLADYGINLKEQAKLVATLDPSTELEATLDDANLNSILDNAYAREMDYLLEDTLVMMNRLQTATKLQSMYDFLEQAIADFENIKKRFAEADA